MRKLQLMLASLAALPLAANALGLGSIRVNSALNEPLQAQIQLLSATPEDIRSLAVQLASHEAFARAGIDRASSLMLLDFKVEEQGRGRYVIDITSKQPIREPFLNFLLDAEWAQGRMLREYTVLLDPPSLLPGAAAPMLASPAVEAPPVIARSESPSAAEPARPVAAASAAATSAPPGRAAPSAPAEPAAPASVAFAPDELFPRIPIGEDAPVALDYGITSRRDTAWSVASKIRPEGVSVQQVLMALLKSNPEAFEGGNINRLKAGHILRIDDPALLTAMSRREAVQAVAEQNAAWDAFKSRFAAAPAKQTVVAGERARPAASGPQAAASAELTLLAAKGERPSAGTLPTGENAAGLEALEDLREQLSAAVEAAETERQRSRELDDRLEDLEQQIDAMQRLISLKDDELAALQEQLRALNSRSAAEAAAAAQAQAAPAELAQPEAPVESQAAAEAVAPPESAVPSPAAAADVQNAESAQPAAAGVQKAESAAPVQNPAPAAAREPAEQVDTAVPPPWQAALAGVTAALGVVAASPLLLAVAATVVILLMLSLVLVVRRRRKLDSQFQESILTVPAAAAAGGTGAAAAEGGDPSSFLSDFAVSGMGDLQAQDSEVDPLTEADVFMAYGRYAQAEELLEQAIRKEPGRAELTLKMLELFHATKNTDRFAALAGELKAKLGETDPQWQKVLGMGRELLPGHALFGGAAAAAGAGMSDEEVLDIGLDTGIFQVDELRPQPGRAPAAAEEEALDLDFGGLQSAASDAGRGAAAEPAAGGGELDFDLEFDTGGPTAAAAPSAEPAASSGGLEFDLDFNLDESSPAAAAPPEPAPAKPAQGEVLEFDLGDLDLGGDTGGGDEGSLNLAELTAGGDDGLDFGELSGGEAGLDFGSASAASFDAGQDGTGLADLDEVGTKLDLARAYIDMGDPDGARSILDEVLEEGDNHQQQEAQDLLKQIA